MLTLRSRDLQHWYKTGGFYTDPEGYAVGVHDPSIINYRDGRYYIAYTTSKPASFGIAVSSDLNHWAFLRRISTDGISGVKHTWAPEWFSDNDGMVRIYFCANQSEATNSGFRIYEMHPIAANNLQGEWSNPKEVIGTRLPSNLIDPFMVKLGRSYLLWYANGSAGRPGGYIELMASEKPTSGFHLIKGGDWARWGPGVDGPMLMRTGAHAWTLCFEDASYSQQERCASSGNDFATFTSAVPIVAPVRAHHGTVIRAGP